MPYKDPERKRANRRAYRAKNRQKLIEQSSAYYYAHKEEILEQHRQYRAENPEKCAAYREARREQDRARSRKYDADHREERRVKALAHAHAHREERLEYSRQYEASHREERKEKGRLYRIANKEKLNAKSRAYNAARKDQMREAHRRWDNTRPDLRSARNARARARRKNAPINDLTAAQWREIKDHYGHKCVYCGRKMERLTQDHITPLSKGGSHTAANVVPACQSCNSKKRTGAPLVPVQPILFTVAPARTKKRGGGEQNRNAS